MNLPIELGEKGFRGHHVVGGLSSRRIVCMSNLAVVSDIHAHFYDVDEFCRGKSCASQILTAVFDIHVPFLLCQWSTYPHLEPPPHVTLRNNRRIERAKTPESKKLITERAL